MDTKKLRQKILDLAIRGKLVPQDPNDEPASVLLERIRAEKQQLIKEGKIKAPKGSKACDTSHYEKIDGPFEIPESWEWCKIDDIGEVITGNTPPKSQKNYFGGPIPFFKPTDLEQGFKTTKSSDSLTIDGYKVSRQLPKNSILVTCIGATIGKTGIIRNEGSCNQQINAIVPATIINPEYIYFLCISNYFQKAVKTSASATTLPILNKNSFAKLLLPLPPEKEQNEIVQTIQKWLSYVENIENSIIGVKKDAEVTKSKILSLAISGKLIPQDPSDEPAIELLRRINPDFKPCDNSQYPYDIPGSWQFATLGEVTSFLSRGKSPKYSEERKYPVFAQKCNQWEGITLEKVQFLEPSTLQKWPDEYKLQDGDVLINSTGTGTLGRTGIFYKNILGGYPFILPDSHVTVVRGNKEILSQEYLFLISRSLYMQKWMIDNMVGSTNQKELYPKALEGFMLAIPPRAEQDRIVSYVKRVIDKVESLVQNI